MNCLDGLFRTRVRSVEAVKQLAEEGYKSLLASLVTQIPVANKFRKQNLKDHFGDVFEDFVFLDTGAGKLEALSKYKSSNMFWIEDKPQNAFTGATQGLVALLLDPPTMQAIIVIMNCEKSYELAGNL